MLIALKQGLRFSESKRVEKVPGDMPAWILLLSGVRVLTMIHFYVYEKQGGSLPMSRSGSIIYQFFQKWDSLKHFGESKHQAKMREKERCKQTGEKWNPARVEGLYDTNTCDQYKKLALKFLTTCRDEYGIKNLSEVTRDHASEYLKNHINAGYANDTIRKEFSALAKLLDCHTYDFSVPMPPKPKRLEITRSRLPRLHDKEYRPDKYKDVIEFSLATGLRRKELAALKPEDIYRKEDGRLYCHVERGKGGRQREVRVLRDKENLVLECKAKAETANRERVFEKIISRIDIHSLRREYAQERYKEVERDKLERGKEIKRDYICRDGSGRRFDKEILREVTQDLGHNRLDVVVKHYLD